MKVFAQHGHQPSDKVKRGLEEGVIEGVILSSRYVNPERAAERIAEARKANKHAEILVDPEFYATRLIGTPNSQLGELEDWPYFTAQRRRDLVQAERVEHVLVSARDAVSELDVSAHIAPNVYISQSFDSIEAGIALNFIERTKSAFAETDKPVYATLAVGRQALLSPEDFRSFLNDLTALRNPPDGFYVLVGGGLITERSDVAHSEVIDANVIGGWMLLNYILSQNGFRVINGCADLLTPFLAAAGSHAGASGWWSTLRVFTMGRYVKPESRGGQQPTFRYVSKPLLNRIKVDERFAYARVLPAIVNSLPHDQDYDNGTVTRTVEALQSWEALASLNHETVADDIDVSLKDLQDRVTQATVAYNHLSLAGLTQGIETTTEYLEQLSGGIEVFKRLAEL